MKKFYTAAAGVLIVLAVFITTASAYEAVEEFAFRVAFRDNGQTFDVETNAQTVGEFLEAMGIEPKGADIIVPGADVHITDGLYIEIIRAFPVYIRVDGSFSPIVFYARPGSTLAGVVNEFRQTTETEYVFDMSGWLRRLSPGDIVDLSTVTRVTHYDYEELPYEREYVYSDELVMGETEVYREGVVGTERITLMDVYVSGERSHQAEMARTLLGGPVNAVVHVGTALPPNHAVSACGEIFSYARSVLMESTAYTLSFECTGRHPGDPWFGVTASGMMAQVGVVAVDTNVIPFHTRLYIEGYGFAVAGDRGGAIRGYKVDVFFDTREEVRNWGRRHGVRVWILDEV